MDFGVFVSVHFRNHVLLSENEFPRLHQCWWQVWDFGNRYRMLVSDLMHWESQQHNEKGHQHNDSASNIWNQSPTKRCHQHHCHRNPTENRSKVYLNALRYQETFFKFKDFCQSWQFSHRWTSFSAFLWYSRRYSILFERTRFWRWLKTIRFVHFFSLRFVFRSLSQVPKYN